MLQYFMVAQCAISESDKQHKGEELLAKKTLMSESN